MKKLLRQLRSMKVRSILKFLEQVVWKEEVCFSNRWSVFGDAKRVNVFESFLKWTSVKVICNIEFSIQDCSFKDIFHLRWCANLLCFGNSTNVYRIKWTFYF